MKKITTILLLATLVFPFGASSQQKSEGVSAPVYLNIRKKVLPPMLSVSNIRFTDTDGNNRIDGLEESAIAFIIENTGTGPAAGMTMIADEQTAKAGLDFQQRTMLQPIEPGKSIEVKLPVKSNISLTDGEAVFSISFTEPLGFQPDPFEVKVATKAFRSPLVKVADHLFITDNGIVKTGYPVKLQVLVQNTGQGKAEQVTVSFGYPQTNVYPNGEENFSLGTLEAGETRELFFDFIPNRLYNKPTIPVEIKISEKFGRYAETQTVEASVDARTENRVIAVTSTATEKVVSINAASLTAEVDKNIPENFGKSENRYALIIGNEDYTRYQPGLSTESNVAFAAADARIFAQYAEKTLGVPKENIVLLENAISTVMNREIEKLKKIIGYTSGKAEVFVFYAGHGFPDESSDGISYLMPIDVSGASVKQGIRLADLYAGLTANPAQRVTVFLDACFSGGGREAGLLAARGVRIKPKDDPIQGNLVVFTASSGEQSALPYRDKQHGMFTYFLLKSIQDTKGNITYGELYNRIKQNVELNSIRINSKDQNPTAIYSPALGESWREWQLF